MMKHVKSIHAVLAGTALAGLASLASEASATVICYTHWPSGANATRTVNMCNSSANGASALVWNGSTSTVRNMKVRFTLGASHAKVLALDFMGNVLSGCEAYDYAPADGSYGATVSCTTPDAAQVYVYAR